MTDRVRVLSLARDDLKGAKRRLAATSTYQTHEKLLGLREHLQQNSAMFHARNDSRELSMLVSWPLRWILVFGVLLLLALPAWAEPWLSTRFAQNCASCHAPGRKNLPPAARRCTLSCQGCHVNPNGGGLRSHYGKWTENRVLRMFRTDALRHDKTHAPLSEQLYGGKQPAADAVKQADAATKGLPLIEVEKTALDEDLFKRDGREFEIVDRDELLRQIPAGDPYRLLDTHKVDAGGDIRWQLARFVYDDGDTGRPAQEEPSWKSFLMAADFGIRHRPVYRGLSLVYEFRVQGDPSSQNPPENALLKGQTRSLYALIDDLPYNVYVMGGLYRPLFGNYVPDHYQLAQEMTSLVMNGGDKTYSAAPYRALSIGTAPNVPYLNVHLLNGRAGIQDDRTRGLAANAGLRFVTLGASVNYSFWRTDDARANQSIRSEMHALGVAAKLWRTVTSLEAVSLVRDESATDFRQGGVYTLDTYTQVWREFYLTLLHARANVHPDLAPGRAEQTKFGLRAFMLAGLDVSLYYELRTQTAQATTNAPRRTTKLNGIASQLHLYF